MILGMKVRKPDLQDMLKFHPKVLEFHFSDSDLNLELDSNFCLLYTSDAADD